MTTSSVSVGARLKRAREDLRQSLKEISEATKIQPWVLEALEADRLHATMSPVYVKSFLTAYAKALRLDPAALLVQMFPAPPEEPGGGQSTGTEQAVDARHALGDLAIWIGSWMRRLAPAALGAAVLAGVILVNPWRWMSARGPHRSASLSVAHKQASPQGAVLHLEPTQPLELVIVARRETWVSIHADGKLLAQQRLAAGEQETWKARRRFELIVGTPSKVDVLLNGQSISPFAMAHRGRLAITHRGIQSLDDRDGAAPQTERRADALH